MTWLANNLPWVAELALVHLALAIPAILASVVIAVPIGRLAARRPRIGAPVLTVATLVYAIPALPLLILIPAITGLPLRSPLSVVIALTAYGVALMVRTSVDAFGSVDQGARAAAIAIGHSARSVFWRVELPLAIPVLLAGVRVVAVSTMGLATVGALIGVSSLGTLLTDGFQRGIAAEIAVGALVTVALALLVDGILLGAGRAATPWTRAATDARPRREGARA
jgi:osmoprotectant transport system permease protein